MEDARYQASSQDLWQSIFCEENAALLTVAEILVRCRKSPEEVVSEALTALRGSPFPEQFGQICAIRAVVKSAIGRNREAASAPTSISPPDRTKQDMHGISSIGSLPWQERAVYFLRKVLHYSRRDTALLLTLSDASVDQLYHFAQRRLTCSDNEPGSPSIEDDILRRLQTLESSSHLTDL